MTANAGGPSPVLAGVRLVGVLRHCPSHHVQGIAAAAVAGGLTAIEVTMDSDDAADQIRRARAIVPEGVGVGAGTVRSIADVDAAIDADAAFLVAPGFGPDVVNHALDRGTPFVPGVMTPSEVAAAAALLTARGFEPYCKLFPAGVVGVDHLRALSSPFSDVRWLCTGGIGNDEARAFLDAGASAIGLGSSIFPIAALATGDVDRVETLVRVAVDRLADPIADSPAE